MPSAEWLSAFIIGTGVGEAPTPLSTSWPARRCPTTVPSSSCPTAPAAAQGERRIIPPSPASPTVAESCRRRLLSRTGEGGRRLVGGQEANVRRRAHRMWRHRRPLGRHWPGSPAATAQSTASSRTPPRPSSTHPRPVRPGRPRRERSSPAGGVARRAPRLLGDEEDRHHRGPAVDPQLLDGRAARCRHGVDDSRVGTPSFNGRPRKLGPSSRRSARRWCAGIRVPIRRAEAGERWDQEHPPLLSTDSASGPVSAASAMMPRPSRSHWIAAPVANRPLGVVGHEVGAPAGRASSPATSTHGRDWPSVGTGRCRRCSSGRTSRCRTCSWSCRPRSTPGRRGPTAGRQRAHTGMPAPPANRRS